MVQRGRHWGMGSVVERSAGRWRLTVDAPADPVTGRRRQRTKTVVARSRSEALRALAKFASEAEEARAEGGSATVREACEAWLAYAAPDLSPNTAREFRGSLERYVYPSSLATRPIEKVKTRDLDVFYRRLLEAGGRDSRPLSPATVRKVHTVLSLAFGQAVRWEQLARNPAAEASPPKAHGGELIPPTPEQVRLLIEAAAAAEDGVLWGTYLIVAATTGRRRGELCGLRWHEVDLARGVASIFRVVKLGEGNELIVAPFPKSPRGEGTISLDEGTVEALSGLRAWQEERAEFFGTRLVADSYVFSQGIDGSRPLHPQVVTHRFGRLSRSVGLDRVRLHDLRHFAATQLQMSDVAPDTSFDTVRDHQPPGPSCPLCGSVLATAG
ncbi:MAG: site-specific integrase [Acidimicrobiales bacterium]